MSQQPNPMDAAMAFWKEAMGRFAPSASAAAPSGGSTTPGAAAGTDPMGWMPTPDMIRRMQSAFLDSLASASEQYMRSPQFLDAMKSSLESAVRMRGEMEDYLRRNISDAMGAPGQADMWPVSAVIEMESRLQSRLDEIAQRLDRLERAEGSASRSESKGSKASAGSAGSPRGTSRRAKA